MATFKAEPGRWAFYSGASDAPYDDPYTNLASVHAHSAFDYLQFSTKTPTFDVTLSVPAFPSETVRTRTLNIGAHGKSGIPFVFGRVLIGSNWVPLAGTTPIYSSSLGNLICFHLAVSSTQVAILETRSYPNLGVNTTRRVQIWVSDNIAEGTLPSLPDTVMAPGLFTAGRIDSRKFYLRRKSGAALTVSAGRTMTQAPGSTAQNNGSSWQAYRYNAGSPSTPINFTQTTVGGQTRTDTTPPAVNPVSYSCMIGGDVAPGGQVSAFELEPGNNYARVIGGDGTVVLDTREEIFHVISKLNGTVTRPSLDWGSFASSKGRSATLTLGTVNDNCTAVLGLARVTYSGSSYSDLPSGYWLVVGGTIVTVMKAAQTIDGTWGTYITNLAMLSFVLNGNQVQLQESIRLKDDFLAGPDTDMAGFTLTFRLFCGTFT
jgi:hypothetical protein